MKPSQYNLVVHSRAEDRYCVFNSRTRAIVELPKSLIDVLYSGQCQGVPKLLASSLARQGILVGDAVDEAGVTLSLALRQRSRSDVRLILIPTYQCNLRCRYCYEAEALETQKPELAGWPEAVLEFLAAQTALPHTPGATLAFFGGEPLLAAHACRIVAEQAHALLQERQQIYYATLTTNGTILNADVREFLKHVNSVQVTLDGVGAEHDGWRCGPSQRGTYEPILKFLAACDAAGVQNTTIRFHMHGATDEYLRQCARELHDRIGGLASVHVYFICVRHSCFEQGMTCSHDETWSLHVDRSLLNAREIFLAEGWDPARVVAMDDSLQTPGNGVNVACNMVGERTFILDGHWNVSFCPVAVRNPQLLLGHLHSGGVAFTPLREELVRRSGLFATCPTCRALPFCRGGCYAKALIQLGSVEQPLCDLPRIDHLIRQACAMECGWNIEDSELLDEIVVRG
jgi:uncharacterized protein